MTYQRERDEFIARMTREGLDLQAIHKLLRCATTIQRLAELACSSEAADRDRVPCPASRNNGTFHGPCLCDQQPTLTTLPDGTTLMEHQSIPRITIQDWNTTQRAVHAVPADWQVLTKGDPRGYTLRVIPPSYAERNNGRDRFNLEAIGVPARDSRLRF